jgi:hypothetical protein
MTPYLRCRDMAPQQRPPRRGLPSQRRRPRRGPVAARYPVGVAAATPCLHPLAVARRSPPYLRPCPSRTLVAATPVAPPPPSHGRCCTSATVYLEPRHLSPSRTPHRTVAALAQSLWSLSRRYALPFSFLFFHFLQSIHACGSSIKIFIFGDGSCR